MTGGLPCVSNAASLNLGKRSRIAAEMVMTSKDVLTPQDVVTGFWQCMDRNDFMSVCDWLSDDFECVWPQSGEIITGA